MFNYWSCAIFAIISIALAETTGDVEVFGPMSAAFCAALFVISEIKKERDNKGDKPFP